VADLTGDGIPDAPVSQGPYVSVFLGIQKPASVTTLSSSCGTSVIGQEVTLTANVSGTTSGAGTPTGSVDFFDQTTNTDLGTVPLTGGSASLQGQRQSQLHLERLPVRYQSGHAEQRRWRYGVAADPGQWYPAARAGPIPRPGCPPV
jgi:hypothetical protein